MSKVSYIICFCIVTGMKFQAGQLYGVMRIGTIETTSVNVNTLHPLKYYTLTRSSILGILITNNHQLSQLDYTLEVEFFWTDHFDLCSYRLLYNLQWGFEFNARTELYAEYKIFYLLITVMGQRLTGKWMAVFSIFFEIFVLVCMLGRPTMGRFRKRSTFDQLLL